MSLTPNEETETDRPSDAPAESQAETVPIPPDMHPTEMEGTTTGASVTAGDLTSLTAWPPPPGASGPRDASADTELHIPGPMAAGPGSSHGSREGISIRVPGFRILGEIGRGGMGVVFKAVQLSLDRTVALKVLPPAYASDPQRLLRFRTEAAAAARLSDARVLPVFDVVEADGVPVLVMPFVEGRDLARIIKDRRAVKAGDSSQGRHASSTLPDRDYLSQTLSILDQVIDAVAAVHEAGVLHRDIKPSNVLVDGRSHVMLTDFGLARLGEGSITLTGAGLGTPGYMSPEQWDGRDVDAQADLFGLGATIYQALTLELPYGRERVHAHDGLPQPPSARGIRVSTDFDAVILKALEPDRRNRYASAAELRDDWQQVRTDRPPKARRVGAMGRLVRHLRRRPSIAINAAVGLVCLALLGLLLLPPPAPRSIGTQAKPRVLLETDPPGARFALVPLSEDDGEPIESRAYRSRPGEMTPVQHELAPGDYLVVVALADGRFHEVFRHVPGATVGMSGIYLHNYARVENGVIHWRRIKIPSSDVIAKMILIPGSESFTPPADPTASVPPRSGKVADFYLDPTEMTVKQYRSLVNRTPHPEQSSAPEDDAVRWVEYDRGLHELERLGKRLPTEREFLYAATNGGTTNYPWGAGLEELVGYGWPFGGVGMAEFDRTRIGRTPVYGLYSNVAEWTSTWFTSGRGVPAKAWPDGPRLRVICGGPESVVEGKPDPREYAKGLRTRVARLKNNAIFPGVGIRGARSARPPYLP